MPRPSAAERLAQALADLITETVAEAVAEAAPSVGPDTAITVSIPEAADRLGLSATSVKRLLASGELPSVLVGDRRLIPVAALEEFVVRRTAG